MAKKIRSKPTRPEEGQKDPDEFISQGIDSAKKKKNTDGEKLNFVQLRLKVKATDEIDRLLEDRITKTSRHNWIMEAIYEKIKKEGGDTSVLK